MNAWQETQMQAMSPVRTESDFFLVLKRAASDLGFDNCAYGMRSPLPVSEPRIVMLNNYPSEWQSLYARRNYLAIDPTVAHANRSAIPLIWSHSLFSEAPHFWEEARSYDLRVGWAQSCHDARGIGGMLTLARSHDELSSHELQANSASMMWLVQLAHETLSRIIIDKFIPQRDTCLTTREMEIMRWTADGKTSSEVAEIMNITHSTVNFHIYNAVTKLGTTNKTAAAIRAMMLRLL